MSAPVCRPTQGEAAADQLILTVTPAGAFVEGSDGHLPCTHVDPRDTEALLATIGRWFLAARGRQEAPPHG